MSGDVEIGLVDGVQTLRLTRPEKKNALTPDMYRALSDALEAGDKSSEVVVSVFLGGEGAFTTGNDISNFLEFALAPPDDGEAVRAALEGPVGQVFRFINVLPHVKKPMIGAVDGLAVGIGTTLLLHCDLVYASDRSVFSTPFLDLGLVPEAASSLLGPMRMGYNRAFEMLVMGEVFSAQRMYDAGVVSGVVAPGGVEEAAMKAARRLVRKPPEALAISRALLRPDPEELAKRTKIEAQAFMERLKSPEAQRAFKAFLSKS